MGKNAKQISLLLSRAPRPQDFKGLLFFTVFCRARHGKVNEGLLVINMIIDFVPPERIIEKRSDTTYIIAIGSSIISYNRKRRAKKLCTYCDCSYGCDVS